MGVIKSVSDGYVLYNPLTGTKYLKLDTANQRVESLLEFHTGSLNTVEGSTSNGTLWDADSNTYWNIQTVGVDGEIPDFTNTSYAKIADMTGQVSADTIPSGASLYGRLSVLGRTNNETVSVRPLVQTGADDAVRLNSLELAFSNGPQTVVETGWTEITESVGDVFIARFLEGKITADTGVLESVDIEFGWRLD